MSRELAAAARLYASRNGLSQEFAQLGAGVHGQVFFCRSTQSPGGTAIKVFFHQEFHRREWEAYERLKDAGVRSIRGLAVPQLIRSDAGLLVLEMTVVERPHLLDFAGAYLDGTAPQFGADVWEIWETEKREMFGERWPEVQLVLAALERYGIEMLDVNPGNLALPD